MNMIPGRMYKHRACTDVAFRPFYIIERDEYLHLQGWWVNITSRRHHIIQSDSIKVKKSNVKNWVDITPIDEDSYVSNMHSSG